MIKHCGNCYVLRDKCDVKACITGNGPLNYKNWKSSSDIKVEVNNNIFKKILYRIMKFFRGMCERIRK